MAQTDSRVGPTWTVGDVVITSVIEVEQVWQWRWLLQDVAAEVAPRVDWLRPAFVEPDGRPAYRFQSFVVRTTDETIVVDTCTGNDRDRPWDLFHRLDTAFLSSLAAAGVDREQVDLVVCTHLHVDHVGWNTMRERDAWVPTFPNARYLIGRVERDYAESLGDPLTESFLTDAVRPVIDAGLVDLVESDHQVCDEVSLEPTPGHTAGHHSVAIASGGERAVITGDMAHHPLQLADPTISCRGDLDPDQSVRTRREAFTRWEEQRTLVIGSHFMGSGAGYLTADGDGWRLVPSPV